jgi:hypothetical protein
MGDGSLLAIRVSDVPCLRRTNRVRFKLLLKDATRALTDGLARSLSFLMHLQKMHSSVNKIRLSSVAAGGMLDPSRGDEDDVVYATTSGE